MKILAFPRDNNPYQELLYTEVRKQYSVDYLEASNTNPFQAAFYVPRLLLTLLRSRFGTYRTLHIHWLFTLFVPGFVPASKYIAYLQTILFLYGAKLMGYRIVWTAHNVIPHAPITSNDVAIRKLLIRLSTAVIVHSSATIDEFNKLGFNSTKCIIIPHGNYKDIYQNTATKFSSRKQLNIPAKAKVLTFFGTIHAYKNVPLLIEAYIKLARENPNLYLIIAGKSSDNRVGPQVENTNSNLRDRIMFYDKRIGNDQVQYFMNAADAAVFPFTEITTSGSILLAATFGVPIVAPYAGSIKDMPRTVGCLYEDQSLSGLADAIRVVLADNTSRIKMSIASKSYADSLSWQRIATNTISVYEGRYSL